MPEYGASAAGLAGGLTQSQAPSIRQAILLALGGYQPENLSATDRADILERCRQMYETDPDAGVHAAVEWVFRAWGQAALLPALRSRLPDRTPVGNWYVTGNGHTMVVFRHPLSFAMGSPASEPRRDPVETRHERLIDRGFAIGAHEVTVAQFERFRPKFERAVEISADPDCPANKLSFYDAVAYCRWLTSEEGMLEDQQCYPAEIGPAMKLSDNFLARTGYRLPTEAEWEYAARAGSTTARFHGEDATLLASYARFTVNSDDTLWPVGRLRPNLWGLCDVYGNVMEWCQAQFAPYPAMNGRGVVPDDQFRIDLSQMVIIRGGAYRSTFRENRSAKRFFEPPDARLSFIGMRLARTMPSQSEVESTHKRVGDGH
jgi:formylglycine-generating enzyme required for sulfatase activity